MANRQSRTAAAVGSLTLALVVRAGFVAAQTAPTPRHTKATLVAETDAVEPGRPLSVGIRLQMEPGWHIYWRNPGDSGLPTRVKWTLPPGFEAGEIRWPYPIRFTTGPLASYGYAHEVLLPAEIRVPAAPAGREVRIAARVDWLECRDVCLPGKTELSLALPVRAGARPGPEAAAFSEARERLPVADPAWRFSAAPVGGALALSIRPPRLSAVVDAYFYATTPRFLDYAKPQALERTKTGYRLLLARDPNGTSPARLAGVLVVTAGGRTRALEVDVGL
jgi:DsbC/DsbD-like thiol-disulfide interchange protein